MTIYALLKGLGEKNTFHGVTSDYDVAETWTSGHEENFYHAVESFEDGTVQEVNPDPIVYFQDDEEAE